MTPAAQMIVRAGMKSPPRRTPSQLQSVTAAPSRTSTPSCSSERRAVSDSVSVNGVEHARRGFNQDDAGAARIDGTEIGGKRALGKLGDGAGHLDAGRAAADHHEGHQPAPLLGVGFVLGALEGKQDAAAQISGVVDRLETRRERGPVVVTEIGVPRAGREHQIVVGDPPVHRRSPPCARYRRPTPRPA